jgi:hypothetical protein
MKKIKYLGALLLLLAASLLLVGGLVGCARTPAATPPSPTELPADTAVPVPAEDGSLWKIALQMAVEQPMRMAVFLDDKVGFTGGEADRGRAHYTTDGGATWTMAETSTG